METNKNVFLVAQPSLFIIRMSQDIEYLSFTQTFLFHKVQENQILFFIGLVVFLISLIITMTSVNEKPKISKKLIASTKEQGISFHFLE